MDFAKKQLTKHGWKDGSGLGKSESGITEAIKVKIKNDNKGVGHDAGAEFTYHWWDHVFNKAASNIDVQTTEEGVELSNTGTTERSKSKSYKADKKMLYGKFVKGSTLSGGTETEEPDKEETEPEEPIKHALMPSNEEEIFKMCGGRTAHKGARHGLKLNGKLQRIEQQEQLLLDKMLAKSANQSQDNICTEQEAVKSANQDCKLNENSEITEMGEKKKSKKKKRKHKETEIENPLVVSEIVVEDLDSKESKKSKKKRRREKELEDDICVKEDLDTSPNDRKKSKHENQDIDIAEYVGSENKSKKKKKKRKKEKDD